MVQGYGQHPALNPITTHQHNVKSNIIMYRHKSNLKATIVQIDYNHLNIF